MANRRKTWVYSPRKQPKPGVPEAIKREVDTKAGELVASVLKPNFAHRLDFLLRLRDLRPWLLLPGVRSTCTPARSSRAVDSSTGTTQGRDDRSKYWALYRRSSASPSRSQAKSGCCPPASHPA